MNNALHREIKVRVGLQGRFKIEAIKRDGSRRVLADWFDNLILNSGLNRIGTASPIAGAMVGTSNTAPDVAQTALIAQLAYTTTVAVAAAHAVNTTDNYASRIITYRFAEGVAAGNLTEVGVGWSSGNCFSRALILDGGGSPTTLTVLSDETLDVTYELRVYPMTADVAGTLTLNAISYDTLLRTARLNTTDASDFFSFISSTGMAATVGMNTDSSAKTGSGSLGDIYSTAGGSGDIEPGTYSPQTYTSSSYLRVLRYTWGLANGTSSFYNIVFRTPIGYFKSSFTPQVPKTSANILTLDLQVTWARKTLP